MTDNSSKKQNNSKRETGELIDKQIISETVIGTVETFRNG